MRRLFHYSFRHKVIIILLLLIAVPFLATWYLAKNKTEKAILAEKEDKLLTLTHILNNRLEAGGFEAILRAQHAQGVGREEKIKILNKALSGITDEVATSSSGLGAGYYSRELDAIITYGPSSSFQHAVGLPITPDHPGRIVMAANTPMVRSGTMVRGDIMNAMSPIEREGQVIGYIWANELNTDISEQLSFMSRSILFIMLLCFGLTFGLLLLFSRRTVRDVDRIIKGVRDMRFDLSKRIESSDGELGPVVNSINAMAEDISKANEERQALALAEAANRAQKEFLARMSHEIRTPMNGVLGMTRLAMHADPPPAQREYLKKIQASASLLLGIINDILDFSRIEAGKISLEQKPFKLHEMVENVRELILPRTREKKLNFMVSIDPSVPKIAVGDELRLSQVLLNLLGNAAKFTLHGFVELKIDAQPLLKEHLRLNCVVRDSGIGMSKEQLQDLFKPFTQADSSTSRRFGGTGLGLSISMALVKLMHGQIRVESEIDKGSAFSFFAILQQFTGKAEDLDEGKSRFDDIRYDDKRFLLVEDNEVNREIALAILSELGAQIEVAENGKEALECFLSKNYDAIFMDVRMPVMDGLEATRLIRASAKHDAATIPVIAMTANAMLEDREASRAAGMNEHIAKPIDVEELKAILFQLFNKRQP